MRVFVVGSMRDNEDNQLEAIEDKERFKNQCRALGEKLANAGDEVILCSESENTADPYVLEGFLKSEGATVNIFYPTQEVDEGKPALYTQKENEHPGAKFIREDVRGGWRPTHRKALYESDVVVALGGGARGTYSVIYSAEVLEKPVLLIPGFKGAAKEAFDDFRPYYDEIGITTELRQNVNANKIHSFLKKIYRKNPFKNDKEVAIGILALIGVPAFIVNYMLFWEPFQWADPHYAVLIMIILSAVIGGVLRNALDIVGAVRPRWNAEIMLEILLGLLLCYGVLFIPQIVGIFLNGKAATIETVEDVRRVGSGLSTISFFGTLFLEKSFSRIKKKGKEIFQR